MTRFPLLRAVPVLLLAVAGCAPSNPTPARDVATRIYDEFRPAATVQVVVEGSVPGLVTAALPRLVAVNMRTGTTYGIRFEPGPVEDFVQQRAVWRFEQTAEGLRITLRMDDREQRVVETFGLVSGTPDAAMLGRAVETMTVQLYAHGQVEPIRW